MGFDNLDLEDPVNSDEPPPEEESSNRTFFIIAGALGFVALLALICIAVYALVLLPQSTQAALDQGATATAQEQAVAAIVAGTATADMMTQIVENYTHTPTVTPIPPTNTPTLTNTPVIVMATTAAPAAIGGSELDATLTATARLATLEAIVTMNASTSTARPNATESMPNSGFADDLGLPMMLGLAVVLIAVIFLARRLRSA
jgi:hypothetical protein